MTDVRASYGVFSRRHAARILACGIAALLAPPGLAASEGPAEAFLRDADEAFRLASRGKASKIERVKRVAESHFDLPAMAEEIVSPLWGSATKDEQAGLVDALALSLARRALQERSAAAQLSIAFVDRQELNDGSLFVSALVSARGRRGSIGWRLVRRGTGFRIVDIVTEAGSIIAELRARFAAFRNQPDAVRKLAAYLAE